MNHGFGLKGPLWPGPRNEFPELIGDREADVVIIGGGLTGVVAAHALSKSKRNIVLLDAGDLGFGMTGMGTGLLVPGLDMDVWQLIEAFGLRRARRFWRMTQDAEENLIAFIRRHRIPCDLDNSGAIMFVKRSQDIRELRKEQQAWRAIGASVDFLESDDLHDMAGMEAAAALRAPGAAVVNQVAILQYLINHVGKRVEMFEHTNVIGLERRGSSFTVTSDQGFIRAHDVIVSASLGSAELLGHKGTRRNTVFELATDPYTKSEWKHIGWHRAFSAWPAGTGTPEDPYDYIRTTEDRRFIVGGEEMAHAASDHIEALHDERLKAFLMKLFPSLKRVRIDHHWTGVIETSKDRIPRIGRKGHLLWSYAYGGSGILWAWLAGHRMADWILKKKELPKL